MSLLEVKGLGIAFSGRPVVEGLDLTLAPSERLGVIGESGSGKSLTALAIAGLLPDTAERTGTILFEGSPLPEDEATMARLRGKRIGMVFQEPMSALNPLMQVGEQIAEAIFLSGDRVGYGTQVLALLDEVGLEPQHRRRYPHELSGGQRQRVMIAMALASRPDLLIADEPTSALDLVTQRQVLDLLDRLARNRRMALLFISHDLKAVAALCPRIMVMQAGRVVEAGPREAILGHPRERYTRMLVGAARFRIHTLANAPMGDPLFTARQISRRFESPSLLFLPRRAGTLAVDAVSLTLRRAESVALVGPSGCGKSTLARIIVGLDRATDGTMQFDRTVYHGSDLPGALRPDISLVFQDPFGSFNPRLRIGASVSEPLRLLPDLDEAARRRRVADMVEAVGLSPDMLSRYPHQFSGGQRQRFAIARALVTRPRLVVLDEPVSALDVSVRGEVLALLHRLRADFGLTYLVISHDLDMVRALADRVLVMSAGRIVEEGRPAKLFEKPEHEQTRALLAARLPEL
ncbi:ABC transporter ATP-binding protein [Arsenicitalea aurantiaca]|uniref:ABC transporter ATP-binding protein n=1 Tax=Arsenicitalea aurantiaca TaxID=1783274 RepID=A0A433XAX7_9HYPH|nr:ABC transporter ATP-binding protein [Arsenicitalea aurantiaca]RUT31225.1 ABC transporter ATP-binding protein [Arsenicitalea aurantiaca]